LSGRSGPSERLGDDRISGRQWRERVTERYALGTINSDEHDAEHGVRSGRQQPMATEQRDEPWAPSSQQYTGKKQGRVCERSGMEGSEASRNAAETNSLDRSSWASVNRIIY